jgi:hypothetical protein
VLKSMRLFHSFIVSSGVYSDSEGASRTACPLLCRRRKRQIVSQKIATARQQVQECRSVCPLALTDKGCSGLARPLFSYVVVPSGSSFLVNTLLHDILHITPCGLPKPSSIATDPVSESWCCPTCADCSLRHEQRQKRTNILAMP